MKKIIILYIAATQIFLLLFQVAPLQASSADPLVAPRITVANVLPTSLTTMIMFNTRASGGTGNYSYKLMIRRDIADIDGWEVFGEFDEPPIRIEVPIEEIFEVQYRVTVYDGNTSAHSNIVIYQNIYYIQPGVLTPALTVIDNLYSTVRISAPRPIIPQVAPPYEYWWESDMAGTWEKLEEVESLLYLDISEFPKDTMKFRRAVQYKSSYRIAYSNEAVIIKSQDAREPGPLVAPVVYAPPIVDGLTDSNFPLTVLEQASGGNEKYTYKWMARRNLDDPEGWKVLGEFETLPDELIVDIEDILDIQFRLTVDDDSLYAHSNVVTVRNIDVIVPGILSPAITEINDIRSTVQISEDYPIFGMDSPHEVWWEVNLTGTWVRISEFESYEHLNISSFPKDAVRYRRGVKYKDRDRVFYTTQASIVKSPDICDPIPPAIEPLVAPKISGSNNVTSLIHTNVILFSQGNGMGGTGNYSYIWMIQRKAHSLEGWEILFEYDELPNPTYTEVEDIHTVQYRLTIYDGNTYAHSNVFTVRNTDLIDPGFISPAYTIIRELGETVRIEGPEPTPGIGNYPYTFWWESDRSGLWERIDESPYWLMVNIFPKDTIKYRRAVLYNDRMFYSNEATIIVLPTYFYPYLSWTETITYTSENGESIRSFDYYDSFGRTEQSVDINASPNGRDIIQFYEYDNMGRNAISHLPYVSSKNNGAYNPNPLSEQRAWYKTNFPDDPDAYYPYSRTIYDGSPMSLPIKVDGVGASYNLDAGVDRSVNIEYSLETLPLYNYSIIEKGTDLNKLRYAAAVPRQYKINKKFNSTPVGEESRPEVSEYYDTEGRLYYRQVVSVINGATTYHERTFYVYDALSRLRYVIDHEALLHNGFTMGIYAPESAIGKYCQYFEYDAYGNVVKQYMPGEGYSEYVYDKRNRLVLSQRSTQVSGNVWSFVKYDIFDRPVITGTINGGNRGSHHAALQNSQVYGESTGGSLMGYTNQCYPLLNDTSGILTVSYYDNYEWLDTDTRTIVSRYIESSDALFPLTGSLTGQKNRVLGVDTEKFIFKVPLYDSKGNTMMTIDEYLNGVIETVENTHDFTGKPLTAKVSQYGANTDLIFVYYKLFTYDNQGRLLKIDQKFGTNEYITTVRYEYDDLGRPNKKYLHNGTDETTFEYNVAGIKTGEISDAFSYRLGFDKPLSPSARVSYNGNISHIWSRYSEAEPQRIHNYTYDLTGQFLGSDLFESGEGTNWTQTRSHTETVTGYDHLNNIRGIKRYHNEAAFDQYDFSYDHQTNPYALTNVSLNGLNSTAFAYDHGRLKYDAHRNINYDYNILDLPQEISSGTDKVKYVYSSSGEKLGMEVDGSWTYYAGGVAVYGKPAGSATESLEYLLHENGMIRDGEYYYHKKDHLGSTRVVLAGNSQYEVFPTNNFNATNVWRSNNTESTTLTPIYTPSNGFSGGFIRFTPAQENRTISAYNGMLHVLGVPEGGVWITAEYRSNVGIAEHPTRRILAEPNTSDVKIIKFHISNKSIIGGIQSPDAWIELRTLEIRPALNVVQTMDYSPLGMAWETNNLHVNKYLFSGKEYQDARMGSGLLGQYDFGSRYYEPLYGRWLVPDPAYQFANPFLYCGNNPIMNIDPDGEWMFLAVAAFMGAYMGGMQAVMNDQSFWSGAWKGGLAGAAGAAAGGLAGSFASSLISGGGSAFVGNVVGGAIGGFTSGATGAWLNGASFTSGLTSGGISAGFSVVNSAVMGSGSNKYKASPISNKPTNDGLPTFDLDEVTVPRFRTYDGKYRSYHRWLPGAMANGNHILNNLDYFLAMQNNPLGQIVHMGHNNFLTSKPVKIAAHTMAFVATGGIEGVTSLAARAINMTRVPVYRVYGGESYALGRSWTSVNPVKIANYRSIAGLPPQNSGEFMIRGTVRRGDIILRRPAIALTGTQGGLPEYLINPANISVSEIRMLLPAY